MSEFIINQPIMSYEEYRFHMGVVKQLLLVCVENEDVENAAPLLVAMAQLKDAWETPPEPPQVA